MTLYKWVREELKKYSFINHIDLKNGKVYIVYNKNDKQKVKTLPYRATKHQLISKIESIKKDINYVESRKKNIEEGNYRIGEKSKMIYYYNK